MAGTIPEPQHWASLTNSLRTALLARPEQETRTDANEQARHIVSQVRANGDRAALEFSRQFDRASSPALEVEPGELAAAEAALDSRTRDALIAAAANIEAFHAAQLRTDLRIEVTPGVVCERVFQPLDAVGLYVPAGTAPLPSTVMMLGIPARLAGCPQRILCTPPAKNGRADSTVLAAARMSGVHRVFCLGGAQAIAAMAYGTESVPRVAKIFGPGNQWVTAAKSLVAQDPGGAACDLPAGPSELLVIADANANAEFVAADLLSQAEHGSDSQVLLITDSHELATRVATELARQLVSLKRRDLIDAALAKSALIVTTDLDEAVAISNQYAPEHLILNVADPRSLLVAVRNAGSVFLGDQAPESVGDYCSGTNHVLPTYGWARSYSGLSLDDFRRSMTVQMLSKSGLQAIGPVAQRLAEVEGLDAHANAITVRLRQNERGAVA